MAQLSPDAPDLSPEALGLLRKASELYAPLIGISHEGYGQFAMLSPIGMAMVLKKDTNLVGSMTGTALSAGVYCVLDNDLMRIGAPEYELVGPPRIETEGGDVFELAAIGFGEALFNAADAAKPTGEAVESVDGHRTKAATAPFKLKVSVRMNPLEVNGEPISTIDVHAAIALEIAETESEKEAIRSLFTAHGKTGSENGALDEEKLLFRQHTIKPRKQVDPNSKVANRITEAALYADAGALLDVSGRKEKGDVLTAVSLNYEGEGVSTNKQLTQFDREVHNAVTTLFAAGNKNVTIAQIWKQLSGSNEKPNKPQADLLRESIDKQRFTRVVIDYTAEARGRELQDMEGNPVTSFVIDDYFLNATKERIETANGREVEGYVINRAPALYEHSQILGQVITYPARLLETSKAGQNTSENIVIKKYLLRRIGMLKGKSGERLSPRIKYTSIYKVAGYEGEGSPDKKQRKRINDYVLECMKIWQAGGHISGFQEYKEGHTRAGVEVSV